MILVWTTVTYNVNATSLLYSILHSLPGMKLFLQIMMFETIYKCFLTGDIELIGFLFCFYN